MIFVSPLDLGPSDLSFGVGFIHHDLTHSRLRSPKNQTNKQGRGGWENKIPRFEAVFAALNFF